ncbi:hypothetical protein GCG21_10990 [Pseudactinotalea sp. HY160]|uniref:hypothetical protein n=1 Tax=Pseudactinotalea sp. HY160 TaxID=2654490 RepID=UPI00128CD8B9|nr:hypothetical protein [Pseudactinotalea sp. HY160]MPV50520.1 hypothetical protein [Pseudactinotalea sp. HY160]
MPSKDRRRSMSIVLAAGVLIAASGCGDGRSEEPTTAPAPTAEPTTAEPTAEPTPEPTAATPTPAEIPNAGQEVRVEPGDAVPFYDFSQSFDSPPHVADIRVTGVEWDWSPPGDASDLCEYDPADGRYVAVDLAIESNAAAESYGTPFSGEDIVITDDAGEPAADYRDWESLACMSPGEEITVSLEQNTSYTGALLFVVEEDASQLRVDFHFDREGVTPTFVWQLSDF